MIWVLKDEQKFCCKLREGQCRTTGKAVASCLENSDGSVRLQQSFSLLLVKITRKAFKTTDACHPLDLIRICKDRTQASMIFKNIKCKALQAIQSYSTDREL